ncbi:CUBN [Branchiostoma lanceolatum]|uniref:CUBN protein n=1 Tax=Branchiostoma lanceolatum TaxID=7740 RepID=A0A8K0EXK7_BRALA|nr:CUBN [Branchiostoma lanceolatum]
MQVEAAREKVWGVPGRVLQTPTLGIRCGLVNPCAPDYPAGIRTLCRVLQTPRLGGSLWFDARGGKELHFLSSLDSASRFRLLPHLGRMIHVVNVLKNAQPELQAAMQKFRQKIDDLDATLVDKCDPQPCKNGGHCVHDPRMTYHCSCPRGRTGSHCEEDVNECAPPAAPPCDGHAYCINTEGSYRCSCKQGWKGDSCLTDTDECLEGTAACNTTHSRCENQEGAYECVCPVGHEGPTCEPIPTTTAETTLRPTTTMLPPTTNALTSENSMDISGVGNSGTTVGNSGRTIAGSSGNNGGNAGGATDRVTGNQGGTQGNPLCGETTFLAGSGYVTSPNYPDHYPNNVDCTYHIAATPGMMVLIRFIDEFGLESNIEGACTMVLIRFIDEFGLESNIEGACTMVLIRFIDEFGLESNIEGACTYDYITVVVNGTTTLGTYCGSQEPPSAITGATVAVRLRTDFAIRRKGFRLRYEAIELGKDRKFSLFCKATVRKTLDDLDFIRSFTDTIVDRRLKTDFAIRREGFRLRYEAIEPASVSSIPETPSTCAANSTTTVSGVTRTLTSPMFPDVYPNDLSCSWTFLAPKDKFVEVRFLTLFVEAASKCNYDRVVVLTDGTETSDGPYCTGNQPSEAFYGKNVTVKFISDASVAEQGFELTYQSVQGVASVRKIVTLTDPLPCGETSFSNTGILESPNYPRKYSNGLHCAWNILVTKGRKVKLWFETFDVEAQTYCQRVKLWFETFDVEAQTYCQYDRVVVETHPGHYHQLCNSKQISPLESRNNQMKVTFITDMALAFTGFRGFWIAQQGYTERNLLRQANVEAGKSGILDCADSNTMMGDPVVLTFGSPEYSWSHEGKPLGAHGAVLTVLGTEASAGRYLCVATSNMTDEVLKQTFNVTVRDADWFGSGEGSASGEGPGSGTDLSDEPDAVLPESTDRTPAQNPRLWDGDSEISSSPGSGEGWDVLDGTVAPIAVVTTERVGAMGEGFDSQGNWAEGQGSSRVRDVLFGRENENENFLAHTEGAMGEGFGSHGDGNGDQAQGFSSVREGLFGREDENESPQAQPEPVTPLADTVDGGIVEDTYSNNDHDEEKHVTTENTTRENVESTNHDTEQDTDHDNEQDTSHDTEQDTFHGTEKVSDHDTEHVTNHDTEQDQHHDTEQVTDHGTEQDTNHGNGKVMDLDTEHVTNHDTEQDTNHGTEYVTNHDTEQDMNHGTEYVTNHDTEQDMNHGTEHDTNHDNEQDTNHDTEKVTDHDTPPEPVHDPAYPHRISHQAPTSMMSRDIYLNNEASAKEIHPLLAVRSFVREIAHRRDSGDLNQASLFHALGINDDALLDDDIDAKLARALGKQTAAGLLQALGIRSDSFVEKTMEAVFGEMHRLREAGNHSVTSLLQSVGLAPDSRVPLNQPGRPEQGVESESDPLANLTALFSETDPGGQVGEGGSFAKTFADMMEMSEGWGKKKKK